MHLPTATSGCTARKVWRGLLSFYVACGIGSIINLAIADWLFLQFGAYWVAGLAGARRRRGVELLHHRLAHLGRGRLAQSPMTIARLEPFRPARADWLQAGLVALALFALYAATARAPWRSRTIRCSCCRAISSASSIRPAIRCSR